MFVCFYFLKKPVNILALVAVIVLGTGLFTIWHQSLFNGKNLSTLYSWTSNPPTPIINLAYGKRTHIKSIVYNISSDILYWNDYNNRSNSGRAVDGNRSPGSGFITNLQLNPWWIVELHKTELIGSIVVYKGVPGPKRNTRRDIEGLSHDRTINPTARRKSGHRGRNPAPGENSPVSQNQPRGSHPDQKTDRKQGADSSRFPRSSTALLPLCKMTLLY